MKKYKKYIVRNADRQEVRDNDLRQAEEENKRTFKDRYKDFYNDVKNTTKTEDW
jgi:formate-dependent nitrite reductase cytochrome c552 subunit